MNILIYNKANVASLFEKLPATVGSNESYRQKNRLIKKEKAVYEKNKIKKKRTIIIYFHPFNNQMQFFLNEENRYLCQIILETIQKIVSGEKKRLLETQFYKQTCRDIYIYIYIYIYIWRGSNGFHHKK